MPRRLICILTAATLAALCCLAGTSWAQIRGIPVGPTGIAPVRIVPIAAPMLPGGSLTPPLGGSPGLRTTDFSSSPAPRIEGTAPILNTSPGGRTAARPENVEADTTSPLNRSVGGPPPKVGREGSPDGGGDGSETKSRGVLVWVKDLPGWIWFLVFLFVVAFLGKSHK